MIAYKFLASGTLGPFTGARWEPGEWVEVEGPLEPCANGIHACTGDHLAYWLGEELWTVEVDGEVVDEGTVLVARRGRLVDRVAGWPASSLPFARDCAARAEELAREMPGDDRLAQLAEEAAYCAERGEALPWAILAGYVAAVAADLREAGGFEAERARQSSVLAELLTRS